DWTNDLYIADLDTEDVTRTELAPGYVFRFALSPTTAIFCNLHPDGDQGHVVDTDPASDTFGQVTTTVPLAPLGDPPVAGAAPWEHESRATAVTPDGALGFISHGGDGLISVIDTEAGEVVAQIEAPTDLTGGGAMIALQDGTPATDTIAR
ncbi:MAG: hypothetical protein H0V24_11660, partial [Chloroflexia bacterium]|nr:hypothetical protein [Chloroflexia bacterium]